MNPFVILPNRILKDKSITDKQIRLLCMLSAYTAEDGYCFPKIATLAEDLGISYRACSKNLSELEKKGLIVRHQTSKKAGGKGANLYYVNLSPSPLPHLKHHPVDNVDNFNQNDEKSRESAQLNNRNLDSYCNRNTDSYCFKYDSSKKEYIKYILNARARAREEKKNQERKKKLAEAGVQITEQDTNLKSQLIGSLMESPLPSECLRSFNLYKRNDGNYLLAPKNSFYCEAGFWYLVRPYLEKFSDENGCKIKIFNNPLFEDARQKLI